MLLFVHGKIKQSPGQYDEKILWTIINKMYVSLIRKYITY